MISSELLKTNGDHRFALEPPVKNLPLIADCFNGIIRYYSSVFQVEESDCSMMEENSTSALNVLVTSTSDGLGREVVRQLAAKGYQVSAVTDSAAGAALVRQDGGLPVYCDIYRAGEIASALRMTQANVMIHTAPQGFNTFAPHNPDWNEYKHLLTGGTAALVQAAEQAGVGFLVHTSYAFLYGDKHGEWVEESTPLAKGDELFAAAAQAEQRVLHSSVPTCVLRAGYLYGAESTHFIALRDALHSGGSLTLGDNHALANWVHTADLANACVLAAEQQPAGEIFNIVDNQPAAPGAFADHFAELYGVKHPGRQRMPQLLAQIMVPATQRALLEVSAKAKNDKASAQLGWQPRYPNFQAGLEQILLAWRAHS